MGNAENLKKGKGFDSRTTEEQRKIARQGGIASGKARAEKKAARAIVEAVFSMPTGAGELTDLDDVNSLDEILQRNPSVKTAIIAGLAKKASEGNIKAAELLLSLSGEYSASVKMAIQPIDESAKELDEYFARKYNRGEINASE